MFLRQNPFVEFGREGQEANSQGANPCPQFQNVETPYSPFNFTDIGLAETQRVSKAPLGDALTHSRLSKHLE